MTENVNREKAIELVNITKHFKGVYANKNINISLYKGEILAILGENGSGKTTLMNMLAGIYQPEEGEIYVNGNLASISSPNDSFNYGIGMVHQHYKLVDIFTAEENILLGFRKESKSEVIARVNDIVNKYGFKINLKKKIHNMSISEKQTIEIVKVLVRRTNFETVLTGKEQKHLTETALDTYSNYDYIIENDSTLESLKSKVEKLLEVNK